MNKKILWLIAYIATGVGMMGEAIFRNGNVFTISVLGIATLFFVISLKAHYKELQK